MVKDLFPLVQSRYDVDVEDSEHQSLIADIERKSGALERQAYEIVRDRYFVTFRDAAEQNKAIVV